jgi:hypothetical protein
MRRRWALVGVWIVGCAVLLVPMVAPDSRVADVVNDAWHLVLSFVQEVSLPVALLLFAGVALLLWRNCERAFRRLDLTDLPPVTDAWGRAQRA